MAEKENNKLKYVAAMSIGGLIVYLLCKIRPAAAEEQPKYSCSGSPCYICYQDDVNGIYPSLVDCESACAGAVPINITVEET